MAISIDVCWIDAGSIIAGLIYSACKAKRTGVAMVSIEFMHHVATGVSLFPIFILMLSSLASGLLTELAAASRIILFISGGYAMFAILEEKIPSINSNSGTSP